MPAKTTLYGKDAAKALRRIGPMAKRLIAAIEAYAADQGVHANNVKALKGIDAKRLRVGDYRVIFAETETTITVTRVGHRSDVYRDEGQG